MVSGQLPEMQSFIHLLMHAFIPVCAFIHACIIHVCTPSCMCAFIHMYMHYACVCLHSRVHAFIRAYVHSPVRSHALARMHSCLRHPAEQAPVVAL